MFTDKNMRYVMKNGIVYGRSSSNLPWRELEFQPEDVRRILKKYPDMKENIGTNYYNYLNKGRFYCQLKWENCYLLF